MNETDTGLTPGGCVPDRTDDKASIDFFNKCNKKKLSSSSFD